LISPNAAAKPKSRSKPKPSFIPLLALFSANAVDASMTAKIELNTADLKTLITVYLLTLIKYLYL